MRSFNLATTALFGLLATTVLAAPVAEPEFEEVDFLELFNRTEPLMMGPLEEPFEHILDRRATTSSRRLTTSTRRTSTTSTRRTTAIPAIQTNQGYGLRQFQMPTKGTNTGGIMSWFRTNDPRDYTNGNSWCYYPYNDRVPGTAVSLQTMLKDARAGLTGLARAEDAAAKWCGLEVYVRTASGRGGTLYLADAFDDTYVRYPNSMDVIKGQFAKFYGRETDDKNVVVPISWRFTGRRKTSLAFRSKTSLVGYT